LTRLRDDTKTCFFRVETKVFTEEDGIGFASLSGLFDFFTNTVIEEANFDTRKVLTENIADGFDTIFLDEEVTSRATEMGNKDDTFTERGGILTIDLSNRGIRTTTVITC
jgi:hypothetical protein